ncbi:MAG: hypothetical protein ACFCA4_12730 [Cyanophyceae cyanobacterium]
MNDADRMIWDPKTDKPLGLESELGEQSAGADASPKKAAPQGKTKPKSPEKAEEASE